MLSLQQDHSNSCNKHQWTQAPLDMLACTQRACSCDRYPRTHHVPIYGPKINLLPSTKNSGAYNRNLRAASGLPCAYLSRAYMDTEAGNKSEISVTLANTLSHSDGQALRAYVIRNSGVCRQNPFSALVRFWRRHSMIEGKHFCQTGNSSVSK